MVIEAETAGVVPDHRGALAACELVVPTSCAVSDAPTVEDRTRA
ncbi:MAG TPA: hypothetical protein VLV81_03125 [Acidimicrobiia bacterium]|nr:hypothetical protein [Acidimicrobiia bacterium]